ncbi:MAG: hypothetical protein U5Q03_07870 [Bacteroidota bacterium]|nr:hypothetical protein [Bacteroidota bacterium]
MAHLSEKNYRLKLIETGEDAIRSFSENDVWFIKLPYYNSISNIPDIENITKELNNFIEQSSKNATISILTSPAFAASFLSELTPMAHFKLWIGVKLRYPIKSSHSLDQNHASLIIITRYPKTLQHTKTRIGYTFVQIVKKRLKIMEVKNIYIMIMVL